MPKAIVSNHESGLTGSKESAFGIPFCSVACEFGACVMIHRSTHRFTTFVVTANRMLLGLYCDFSWNEDPV